MARSSLALICSCIFVSLVSSMRYDADWVDHNLNTNQSATRVLDYWGEWDNHTYHPSPNNWRMPFYGFFIDRFVNGDPTNDNANDTAWEHDLTGTQLRHGGDIKGLQDSLDYLAGMGIKGLYLAGSPFINKPWASDSYSPVDLTLLDKHFGTIQAWRTAINEIHARGMYVVMDNTMATMGDLIGFVGYLNTSAPFKPKEHNVVWKTTRRYLDFEFGMDYIDKCDYPRFYGDDGLRRFPNETDDVIGCRDSEFDQYGEIGAFDDGTEWRRQLSKFAYVQDRLREWRPDVRERIQHLSCIQIAMLDLDGFRMDKGIQITVDAQGEFAHFIRSCAKKFGKENFFIPGEIVSGNALGAVYVGRGKQPDMAVTNLTSVVTGTGAADQSNSSSFIRDAGQQAFDGATFHYSIYRSLLRFLGIDGSLAAGFDVPVNWVEGWEGIMSTNDMVNAMTGEFDPRHMYGTSNQDTFRWPGIKNGTAKQILAHFVTTLIMPGIPLLTWGEEQAFYVYDNTAANYVYGRSSMSSATAWQDHGCYKVGTSKYHDFPADSATRGCQDDGVSFDHRDPSHPVRNILKIMYEMRNNYAALNDGFYLQQLSNNTYDVFLPGSSGVITETGLWSSVRKLWPNAQNMSKFSDIYSTQDVWLLYTNENRTRNYTFDCAVDGAGLITPYPANTTVQNLFWPWEQYTTETSAEKVKGINGTSSNSSCVSSLKMKPWAYKALVPVDDWILPSPVITDFFPGHDARIESSGNGTIDIRLSFSQEMSCSQVTNAISISSTTEGSANATLDESSVVCSTVDDSDIEEPTYIGMVATTWTFSATLKNVDDGVHVVTVNNATSKGGSSFTGSADNFMLRIGQLDNPMVFPRYANYTTGLLHQDSATGELTLSHKAAGADKFRYSLNWGSSWSDWLEYTGKNMTLDKQPWSGTKDQEWTGPEHVIVNYWSQMTGSSSHVQQADAEGSSHYRRRYPHLFMHGKYNEFGYDAGLPNKMEQDGDNEWYFNFMTEWPSSLQVNGWGVNPDGQPDLSVAFGDVDGDNILDRLAPDSLLDNVVNFTGYPPDGYVAWRMRVNDGSLRYTITPFGSASIQITTYFLFFLLPITTGFLGCFLYLKAFYQVKLNTLGLNETKAGFAKLDEKMGHAGDWFTNKIAGIVDVPSQICSSVFAARGAPSSRRSVLIATMEYDIQDWGIKIKIGGLGVMAQLMGKNLQHLDVVWVVPCVGGIDYPQDTPAEPMLVTILGKPYPINVQYHKLDNVTYLLLDAPVFRQQSKDNPYPPRMDDFDSAIYYSAWNQCIAEATKRFHVDLYHINDYHGSLAPLYLLPQTIPCCLSLHNAEFQGLWPMRTQTEFEEVCGLYNLDGEIVKKYVQFGEVFNLLHAGASYLRVHQKGFGAVGVSQKYGKRSFARYPIFWGLSKIGSLPNPDPTDTGDFDKELEPKAADIHVDQEFEAKRGLFKRQAQEWAGLDLNPDADLFVFVGRWSLQKGVDLIADVFPAVLEKHANVQLVCIGPVIDLYGKFAARKLEKLMKLYPGRVFSKPEFTSLPPEIFSGAEFALIPSRDEPFGLVALEFGRKGALGVGSRVGGLGTLPGWWYTVESTTTKHLLKQFKSAIESALASTPDTRATMRAHSAKQRFPVMQWKADLEKLQSRSIEYHHRQEIKRQQRGYRSGWQTPASAATTAPGSPWTSRPASPARTIGRTDSDLEVDQPLSMGLRTGPGYQSEEPKKRFKIKDIAHKASMKNLRGRSKSRSRPSSPALKISAPIPIPQNDFMTFTPPQYESNPASGRSTPRDRPTTAMTGFTESSYYSQGGMTADPNETDDVPELPDLDEYYLTPEQVEQSRRSCQTAQRYDFSRPSRTRSNLAYADSPAIGSSPNIPLINAPSPSPEPWHPAAATVPPVPSMPGHLAVNSRAAQIAQLRISRVGDMDLNKNKDYRLQNVDPFFTDEKGEYYDRFGKNLENLNGKTSEGSLCIEDYLMKSEKDWFNRFHDAKMGEGMDDSDDDGHMSETGSMTEFHLNRDYVPPSGIRRLLHKKFGDWPIYAFMLAFGQIIAANSYQITLLTGTVGQTASKLYVVCSIYMVFSAIWWAMFRTFKSLYVISLPFILYGLAFFLLGISPYVDESGGKEWIQNVATGLYAAASASGSFFFALNFGAEGSAPVQSWSFRACVIQGTQQIYVVALWYWGAKLTSLSNNGTSSSSLITYSWPLTAITIPIAIILWIVGLLLYLGLPDYYRQAPGAVPSFYSSILRRKVILWFFISVIIQNFFLSTNSGRSWLYLWSSKHAPTWAIVLLVILFFIILWAAFLYFFGQLSLSHSWILPIFAVGLGAPRWCQMIWAVSGIGAYMSWTGGPVSGAILARILWLWLGLLDALQGVGLGMILLQTLTRFHITFTLICAQIFGSVATIVARACAPNKLGPGPVFPNFVTSDGAGLGNGWFWSGLIAQLIVSVGFFKFFRKEQLSKP